MLIFYIFNITNTTYSSNQQINSKISPKTAITSEAVFNYYAELLNKKNISETHIFR
jgi:hypothetical protein